MVNYWRSNLSGLPYYAEIRLKVRLLQLVKYFLLINAQPWLVVIPLLCGHRCEADRL